MSVKTYDAKSHELAAHFLSGFGFADAANRERVTHELALAIQEAVEDFIQFSGNLPASGS